MCIRDRYINKRMENKEKELIASQDEVLQYLTAVMRGESKAEIVVLEAVSYTHLDVYKRQV